MFNLESLYCILLNKIKSNQVILVLGGSSATTHCLQAHSDFD